MKKQMFGLLSILPAVTTVVTYFLVNCVNFGLVTKWWLFGCHLLVSLLGLLIGLWAVVVRQWWGLVAVVVCGYFLWIQFFGVRFWLR